LPEFPSSLLEDIKVEVEVEAQERQGEGCMNILLKRGDHGRAKRV
jgi:hypothetical protein